MGGSSSTAPSSASATKGSIDERLKTLKRLLDGGLLSQADSDKKKKEILAEI